MRIMDFVVGLGKVAKKVPDTPLIMPKEAQDTLQ